MADFLGGLLSGGGGLYDDLLTPQQQSQLSSRGLLSMAGAFADAAMPSRLPIPLGAAIGKAAAAMSGGRDEAALRLLQGQKLSQEVQTMKATTALQQQFMKDIQTLPLDVLFKRYGIGAGGGAPAAAGATTSPLPAAPAAGPAAPAEPDAAPAPAGAMFATPPIPSIYGNPPRQNLSPYTGLRPAAPAAPPALLPMPAAPPGGRITPADYGVPNPPSAGSAPLDSPPTAAERLEWNQTVGTGGLDIPLEDWVAQRRAGAPAGGPSAQPPDAPPGAGSSLNDRYGGILAMAGGEGGASGSSLPPPDELIRQGGGPGGLLQASYRGAPPFGAGGDEVGSGGGAADAGRQARVDFWQSQGAPAHVAQGIADRVKAESSFNPSAMGDSNTSGGLYQHHADRLTRLKTFAAGQGKAWTDPNVQDQFAAGEVRGGDAIAAKHWPEIMAAPTREAAATLWDRYFERSKYGPGAGGRAPDEVIRSGAGVPGFTRAQYSGAAPTPPAPPGVDPQAMNTLLLELAKRNAMAEILKLGNPYSSMLSVLQGSPEYKAQIETATRGAGLPFVGPEEAAKKGAAYPFEAAMEAFKTQNQAFLKDKEQLGAAALDPAPNGILTRDAAGNTIRVQGTKLQAAAAARGLGVPELGIPALVKPPAGVNAPAVSPVGEPVLTPGQIKTQEGLATHTQARINNYREAADAAASAKTTLQGISGEIGKVVTGPFADYAQNAALYLNTIAPGFSGQVKAYEDMASQANELVRKAVRASDPNPSFVQTRMAMDSMPIPSKSEGGLYKITNRMIGLQDHDIARGNATQIETPGGAEKFDSWWRQNVSPYAFVFAKLAPDDRDSLINTLQKTAQGKRELETIGKQLQFIEQHGGFGIR